MQYLSSIQIVNQTLCVLGMFIAHNQEVFTVYVRQLVRVVRLGDWLLVGSVNWNVQRVPTAVRIMWMASDYGQQTCLEHVEFHWQNKLYTHSASSCFSLQRISISGFGGPVVSILPSGTRVRGFEPGQNRRIFQGEKILSKPSFGGEVKLSVPCRRFAVCKWSFQIAWNSLFDGKINKIFLLHSSQFPC
jgi:hypothetical protein